MSAPWRSTKVTVRPKAEVVAQKHLVACPLTLAGRRLILAAGLGNSAMTDHSHELAHKGDASLDRLLFFSDGVFAIAITLLSIELHPPHDWDGSLAMLVRQGWPMLMAFAVSFAVIGVFWNSHRRIFLNMTRYTSGVFWLNLGQLACIALMPFATSLTYQLGAGVEKFFIYLGLVTATGLIQGFMYGYGVFIADVIRPRAHWMRRLSVFLTVSFTPGAACGLSLLAFSGGSAFVLVGLAATVAFLVGFGIFTGRRYPLIPQTSV